MSLPHAAVMMTTLRRPRRRNNAPLLRNDNSSLTGRLTTTTTIIFIFSTMCYYSVTVAAGTTSHNSYQVSSCPSEQLAQYRVVLNTFWSKDDFPKHYPKWRPHAQWTKLLGVSHNTEHSVFATGKSASAALKEFVETGRSDHLDAITYANQGTLVLDAFYAPAIGEGVGTTQAMFFVDGNHSMVSMVSKIVPSPDWFVGVDSLELCSSGSWINATSIQLSPMDAGTDQGLAFTSPSWQLSPQDPITRITHNSPSHPASSFAYHEKSALPTLATLSIVKVREYRLVKPSPAVTVPLRVLNFSTTARDPSRSTFSSTSHATGAGNNVIAGGKNEGRTNIEVASYDTSLHYQTHSQNNNAQTLPQRAASIGLTQNHQGRTSNNIISHDTPSSDIYSNDISSANNIQSTSSDSYSHERKSVASDTTSHLSVAAANADSNDLPYNEVLPREQYDREVMRQKHRDQQALENHQKLQQLLKEKSKKLKEKKRKHRERKLSALQKKQLEETEEPGLTRAQRRHLKSSSSHVIPRGDAMSVIDSIVEKYQREQRRKRRQQRRQERRRRRLLDRINGVTPKRGREAVDCVVGEWSSWSECSKTCGIGEQVRKRDVTQQPRRGGLKCPAITETTWCGSARDCHRDYFKW